MLADLAALARRGRELIRDSQPDVAIICGPVSLEDRIYYEHRAADAVSAYDIQRALQRLGVTRVDVIDVTTSPGWIGRLGAYDLIIVNLHGSPGEDGTIQGMLEVLGLRFLGSGVEASAVALNKYLTKLVATQAGVPTPRFSRGLRDQDDWRRPSGRPMLVKPLRGGSSLGVELLARDGSVDTATQYLVEEFLEGDDVTVTVIEGDDSARALPAVVLRHRGSIYDLTAKLGVEPRSRARAERPSSMAKSLKRCEELAVTVHDAIGARHVSRSDFIVVEGEPYFLEINTIPGLSEPSNAAECAYAAGLDYDDFIALVVRPAIAQEATG